MSGKIKQNFDAFCNSIVSNGIIDPKTTVMIQLASAMAMACYPCMEILTAAAREKGVSDEELSAINGIVMVVGAGRVFHQYRDACGSTQQKRACCG